jgi:hypothetical protein
MIEYSIEELKYYYHNNKDCDAATSDTTNTYQYDKEYVDSNSRDSVEYLENTLTDLIDNDYIENSIYHVFPIFVCAIAASFFTSAYIAFG